MRIDLVTTVMEIAAVLCLVIAAALAVGAYNIPAGVATAGVALLAGSWAMTRATTRRRSR